ncbi:hypothetical protein SAMN05216489_06472 [Streptomyces sp. 3213]|uniref:hypothetical protein n=1 Tax=Streptomyces sp. 3213.3 TaxID=1855348 RepID=UPI0008991FFD|nr:hypothetical protein [Streptomyces sp. 3213.3]SEE39957.1 hypothetical protein SAMN05216489_06472 [Streptomyces sp. 3213] [Streptomyces sp. 3213.3]
MIANLFTVRELGPADLRAGLADLLGVAEEAVDASDRDGDQETRRWDAPVLCTYCVLPPGDLALELDLHVEDGTAGAVTEADLAHGLAVRTATSVLYPALDLGLDSAYWVAVPDGRAVRCRLEAIDSDEDTTYRVDAVEDQVPDLPRARVENLPEALDGEPMETPVSDAFLATYPTGTTASVEGRVHYSLRVWERLVRRLATEWSPSGRYREDLFQRDLRARDDLGQLVTEVDAEHAERLRTALARLDDEFRNRTELGDPTETGHWWRDRSPRSLPW